jgi:hypothetical protein
MNLKKFLKLIIPFAMAMEIFNKDIAFRTGESNLPTILLTLSRIDTELKTLNTKKTNSQ